jgi:hypothetical protein
MQALSGKTFVRRLRNRDWRYAADAVANVMVHIWILTVSRKPPVAGSKALAQMSSPIATGEEEPLES